MRLLMLALMVALGTTAFAGSCVQVGDTLASLAARGTPSRVIETGDGKLLFYGSTLIFVTNGVVGFVSVGSGTHTPPTASASARPNLTAAPDSPPKAHAPWEVIEPARLDEREQAQQRYQMLATRAKRCALTKSFAAMGRDFRHHLPLAVENASDSVFRMHDSRGHALPAYGDSSWTPTYGAGVAMNLLVMAE